MPKTLQLVLIHIFLLGISVNAQTSELVELNSVAIPEDVFIGEIRHLDIDDERILITDTALGQVVLFTGEEWKILNPEECHPGFKFYPIQAQFGDNDEIFITNSGIWGFRFKKNGSCVGAVKEKSMTPEKFHYSNEIIGISSDLTQKLIKIWDKEGIEKRTVFSVKNKLANAEYRFEGGGILGANNSIYFARVLEPIIYSYNRNTKELNSKKFNSKFFIPLKTDISNDINDPKMFQEIAKVFNNNSLILNLFQLDENLGILTFRQNVESGDSYFGLIFRLDDLSIQETLSFEINPVFVRNNEFVFIERESNGYENEIIKLVFKTINKN